MLPATQRGNYAASALLNEERTVYAALIFGGPQPVLLSLDKSRLIAASPFWVKLTAGASQNAAAFEANFSGTFVAAVTTTAVNPQPVCPLAVNQVSRNVFNIKATAAVGAGCAVTLTDSDGFATALVAVSPA